MQDDPRDPGFVEDLNTATDTNVHEGDSVAQVVAQSEQSLTEIGPVDLALATALERASAAGEWGAVMAITAELAARRER